MKTFFIQLFFAVIFSSSFPGITIAHQSGCHRWHSCPSDSGSYVCGDLGYTSQCPVYKPPSPSPPPPAPKIETWTFNEKTYYSYSDYLEAKATFEANQRQKQEEEKRRL